MNVGRLVLQRILPPVALLVLGIAIVQVVVTVGEIPPFVLASPSAIWEQLVQYAPQVLAASLVTGANALWGLLAGTVLGVLLAVIASFVRVIDGMLVRRRRGDRGGADRRPSPRCCTRCSAAPRRWRGSWWPRSHPSCRSS